MKHITNYTQIPSNAEILFEVLNIRGNKSLSVWKGNPVLAVYEKKDKTSALDGSLWVLTKNGMKSLDDAGVTDQPYNMHKLFLTLEDAQEELNR